MVKHSSFWKYECFFTFLCYNPYNLIIEKCQLHRITFRDQKSNYIQSIGEEILFSNFFYQILMLMPGGRARGNLAQIFSEIVQNFPSTDLKNVLFFDITIGPPFTWSMNFGQSPLHKDFSIFGPLCVYY